MTLLVTLLLTLIIAALLFILFRWVKTPWYRVDADKMRQVLEMVLTGQATENDWRVTMEMPIRHNEQLEALRQQCLTIEEKYNVSSRSGFLFSKEGLSELQLVYQQLTKLSENNHE